MEELMALRSDDYCSWILVVFSRAHRMEWQATGNKDHARSYAGLVERRIPLLGKLQRFWDQGESMCILSNVLRLLLRKREAATWFQRARDVGAAHGFFSLESKACIGLGQAAMEEGRNEEGLALLRNSLVAAELNELDDAHYELRVLEALVDALFTTTSIDEVEPLVLRYREAAKACSGKEGFGFACDSLLGSARLHEVLCIHPAFGKPFLRFSYCYQHGRIASDCGRLHRSREKTHAPVEPCALRRHAGSLKRPRGKCALCST